MSLSEGAPSSLKVDPQQNSANAISLSGVSKWFQAASGRRYVAVEKISMDVQEGTFVAVVGPSGCGKSTLLNVAAGLTPPAEGSVTVYGQPLSGINRRASYMFQQDGLLPWKSVLDNIMLGPVLRGKPDPEAADMARQWIARIGLNAFESSFPHQLSGGMRKRVAMAQAWIVNPDILLMDEPFSALDIHTRHRMEHELLNLWSGSRKSVLFVTHDLEEAISLADEVAVLSAGPASRLVNRYPVDLPRPRNLIDIRTQPEFLELYRHIWADLREEVLKSYERIDPSVPAVIHE